MEARPYECNRGQGDASQPLAAACSANTATSSARHTIPLRLLARINADNREQAGHREKIPAHTAEYQQRHPTGTTELRKSGKVIAIHQDDEVGAESQQFYSSEKRICAPMQRKLPQSDSDDSEERLVQRFPLNLYFSPI